MVLSLAKFINFLKVGSLEPVSVSMNAAEFIGIFCIVIWLEVDKLGLATQKNIISVARLGRLAILDIDRVLAVVSRRHLTYRLARNVEVVLINFVLVSILNSIFWLYLEVLLELLQSLVLLKQQLLLSLQNLGHDIHCVAYIEHFFVDDFGEHVNLSL